MRPVTCSFPFPVNTTGHENNTLPNRSSITFAFSTIWSTTLAAGWKESIAGKHLKPYIDRHFHKDIGGHTDIHTLTLNLIYFIFNKTALIHPSLQQMFHTRLKLE